MAKVTIFSYLCAVVLVAACGQPNAEHGDLANVVFYFDHVNSWNSRDLSGLNPGQPLTVEFDVYLPDGGSWDAGLEARFAAWVQCGRADGAEVVPIVSMLPVDGHANVRRLVASVSKPTLGVYWCAVNNPSAQPIRAMPGLTPINKLPAFASSLSHQQPGFWLRTVGHCPHAVEFAKAPSPNSTENWQVRFSEPISAAAEFPMAKVPATAGAAQAKAQWIQGTVLSVELDKAVPLGVAIDVDLGKAAGLATAFATGSCSQGGSSVLIPRTSLNPSAAFDYQTLARKIAPKVYGQGAAKAGK